jgi:NAD(P)-dependent dehydrogenase (short-subunit alcohol dehydrogenase family)
VLDPGSDLRLDGLVAVVTGGASGIGLATARRAGQLGARVAVMDVAAGPADLLSIECDVADRESVQRAFAAVRRTLGPVQVLVNNAGVAPPGTFEDLDLPSWERTLRINLTGAYNCCQAMLPHLRTTRHGSIVNVASLAGKLRSLTADAAYSASKGGLIAFTRHLAGELAADGIRVNCVCPGAVDTAILERNLAGRPQRREAIEASVPLGRMASPAEIAAVICFLAAPAASYMTGAAVDVNGGML